MQVPVSQVFEEVSLVASMLDDTLAKPQALADGHEVSVEAYYRINVWPKTKIGPAAGSACGLYQFF